MNITPIIEAFCPDCGHCYRRRGPVHQEPDYRRPADGDRRLGENCRHRRRADLQRDRQGPGKKKYVEDWLKAHGVTVDSEKLDAMIESAVYELKNGFLTIEGGLPGTP